MNKNGFITVTREGVDAEPTGPDLRLNVEYIIAYSPNETGGGTLIQTSDGKTLWAGESTREIDRMIERASP